MELITILKNIFSFLWKGRSYILTALVYFLGRKSAKKEDQVSEQQDALHDQERANQTLQAMQDAAIKAPKNKDDLIAVLDKGGF